MKRAKKVARVARKIGKPQKSQAVEYNQTDPAGPSGPVVRNIPQIPGQSVPNQEIETTSPEQTFELGRSIAGNLAGPAVILVSGDLGAGKTVFAKGVAAGLDIDPVDVTSPSFTLINVHNGRLRLYHIDLWRLDNVGCAGLGLEEIFDDPRGVIVVEWAERLPSIPRQSVRVHIEHLTESSRKVIISASAGL